MIDLNGKSSDSLTERQTNGQADSQTDRCADRRTDKINWRHLIP